jgi:hypothetical protein
VVSGLFITLLAAMVASLLGTAAALTVGFIYLDQAGEFVHPVGFIAVYLGVALPTYWMMWRLK